MANNLPTVTSPLPRDLQQFVQRVREALDGGGTEAVVTARQLIAAGVVKAKTDGTLTAVTETTVFASSPPTSLTATGALASILVSWNPPTYSGHAYTEIWAHTADVIGSAELVGMTAGNSFSHNIGGAATRYYWVRNVNQNGAVSAYNATNGVSATTGTDPAYLLSVLTGEVTSSQLANNLSTRIDLIDAADTVSGSVNARLLAETQARTSSINSLSSVVSQLTGTAAYSNTTTYSTNDLATYNNNLYKAKQSTTGNLPTNTTYWDLVGNYSSISQVVVANSADISAVDTRLTTAEGNITSQASSITTLQNEMDATETATSANNTAITGLDTRLTTAEGSITSSASDITALDTRLTVLDNTTNGTVGANATAINTLDGRVTTAEGSITTNASNLTSLTSTVTGHTTSIGNNATAITGLDTRVTTAEGSITTNASDITSLSTTVGGHTTSIGNNATALTNLTTRVTSAEGSITSNSSDITSLSSTVGGHTTDIGNNATALTNLTTRVTTAEGTITSTSSALTSLTTTVSGNTTSINTQATSINGLEAQYTVKIDNNGHLSGFGLASNTATSGDVFSEFMVSADRFSIVDPDQPWWDVEKITFGYGTFTQHVVIPQSDWNNYTYTAGDKLVLQGHPTVPADNTEYTITGKNSFAGVYFIILTTSNNNKPAAFAPSAGSARALLKRATTARTPFVVTTSSSTINGVTVPAGVFMDTAMIADATITNAKIGDAAITSAKIANATIVAGDIADATITGAKIGSATITGANIQSATITSANIQNGTIQEADIGNAQITNAKIADVIQSSGYSAGSAGWKIDKSGSAEFNDATFRGTLDVGGSTGSRMTISSTKIEVYDGSTLRVKIGDLS